MHIFIFTPQTTILLILLSLQSPLLLLLHAKNQVQLTRTNSSSAHPMWLRRVKNPRHQGCWRQPWICRRDDSPSIKRRCCRDRCVDVRSDENHCGLCGIRCPFTWQCCGGICVDTNINPFHCGSCDRRCPFLIFCYYGMCGYAQPFPFPPRPWPKPCPHKPCPRRKDL